MEEVNRLCEAIAALAQPQCIILFNQKRTLDGALSSFKLCVVANGNPAELEGKIYLSTDCPLHFDVLVYSVEDFARFSADQESFAYRILTKGSVIYGQAR